MATIITWNDVLAIAPSLATGVSSGAQTIILAAVGKQVGSGQWDTLQTEGQLALAAHMGILVKRSAGVVGPVISETVGPVTRTYALLSSALGSLGSTSWGMEYQRLMQLLPSCRGLVI
jgi:hypothetical protein